MNILKIRFFELFDYVMFFCVTLLVILGISFIYSSGITFEGVSVSNEYVKQIIWASFGLVLMFISAFYDYRHTRRFVNWLYVFLVVVLLYTKFFGRYVNGARSWIGVGDFGLQPSEFCKIVFILFLANYFENTAHEDQRKRFATALAIMMVPMGLILLQPDLGTASVYITIFLFMCFVAGIPLHYILMVVLTGVLTVFFTVLPVWQTDIAKRTFAIITVLTNFKFRLILILGVSLIAVIGIMGKLFFRNNKYYFWIAYFSGILVFSLIASLGAGKILKEYQLKRLIIYIDPSSDPLGSGWNIIQSRIAIGSGGLLGRGFLNGTQSHYRFLPQQSTDFIFSILSEEFGFIGGLAVFLLYFIILFRIIQIMKNTQSAYGYYIASGIFAMFFFHFVVNVGMVMGIMPITGIPLLFLSYGGSSLWAAMICIGILMSINFRRFDFMD